MRSLVLVSVNVPVVSGPYFPHVRLNQKVQTTSLFTEKVFVDPVAVILVVVVFILFFLCGGGSSVASCDSIHINILFIIRLSSVYLN